jgi:hypothetical protein
MVGQVLVWVILVVEVVAEQVLLVVTELLV